jgi:hypothetical protein
VVTVTMMTGAQPTRRELDVWWLTYEEARDAGADIRGWLDGHPYPTSSPEHAASIRLMILKAAGLAA